MYPNDGNVRAQEARARASLLVFPETRIVRHRRMKARRTPKPAPKKNPVLIAWTGLIMIVRLTVPPAIYILAGGGVLRFLGL
jgi:hypothetical protein